MTTTPTGPQEVVKETWMPTTAGILSIVAGASELVGGIIIGGIAAVLTALIKTGLGVIFGFPLIAFGIVAIVGGIFALRRRVWRLALAGAICSVFMPHVSILGILAIIFVVISKREFK